MPAGLTDVRHLALRRAYCHCQCQCSGTHSNLQGHTSISRHRDATHTQKHGSSNATLLRYYLLSCGGGSSAPSDSDDAALLPALPGLADRRRLPVDDDTGGSGGGPTLSVAETEYVPGATSLRPLTDAASDPVSLRCLDPSDGVGTTPAAASTAPNEMPPVAAELTLPLAAPLAGACAARGPPATTLRLPRSGAPPADVPGSEPPLPAAASSAARTARVTPVGDREVGGGRCARGRLDCGPERGLAGFGSPSVTPPPLATPWRDCARGCCCSSCCCECAWCGCDSWRCGDALSCCRGP